MLDRALSGVTYILFSLLLSACGGIVGPANLTDLATQSEPSCGFVQNTYGQRVSWKLTSPVLFYIDDQVTTEYELALRDAIATWESVAGHSLVRLQRMSGLTSKPSLDGKNIIYLMSDWSETASFQQAVTNVYWVKNQIIETDIKIDQKYFKYFFGDNNSEGAVHFASLMLHEMGHALGLAHAKTQPTVMWPSLASDLIRMDPSPKDQGNLKCEY